MSPWIVVLTTVIGSGVVAASMLTTAHWLFLPGALILVIPAILGLRGRGPSSS